MTEFVKGYIYMFPAGYFRSAEDIDRCMGAGQYREYTSWYKRLIENNRYEEIGIKFFMDDGHQMIYKRDLEKYDDELIIVGLTKLGGL